MNTILTILVIVLGIIALLLILALFMKKKHYVNREIIIHAPTQEVFDFLRLLSNQEKFNKWAKTDPDRKIETRGIDGTIGYIYAWSGNKNAGEGEKEIKSIVEGERIETEIRFVKPMKISSSVIMETKFLSENETKVSLINAGTLPYPLNIMIPMFQKNFAKDIDESLYTLKNILENRNEA